MFGTGVLKSMAVTLKNLVMTYTRPKEGIFTVQYPETKKEVEERFRNFPFLVYDGKPDNMRCVACDICAKECPPKCITIVMEKDAQGKAMKRPAVFDIDFSVCMNCGICEEVCPFDAIFMDHEYELSTYERQEDLVYNRDRLLKSAEYFEKIRPHDAKTQKEGRKIREALKQKQAQAPKPLQP